MGNCCEQECNLGGMKRMETGEEQVGGDRAIEVAAG
jgi:hypothetical protein